MNNNNISILCIEDDSDTCELLEFVFKKKGCQVSSCSNNDCLKITEEQRFSAIILDNYFGELSGVDICRRILEIYPSTPIIFFSGEARQSEIDIAIKAGASAYLVKPNDFDKLVETTFEFIEKTKFE